MSNRRAR